jgi:hypothetical protein
MFRNDLSNATTGGRIVTAVAAPAPVRLGCTLVLGSSAAGLDSLRDCKRVRLGVAYVLHARQDTHED